MGSVVFQVVLTVSWWSDFREPEDGSEWDGAGDEEGGSGDDDDYDSACSFSDEAVSAPGRPLGALESHLFWEEETKSRFTDYSMTSSVMRRNEQLTLHDERFEKVRSPVKGLLMFLIHDTGTQS